MTGIPEGPVLIELEDAGPDPATAPIIDEPPEAPSGQAMRTVGRLASRRASGLTRWFWRSLAAVAMFFLTLAAWDAVVALFDRSPALGWIASGLLGLFLCVCLAIAIREWAALARLARIESLHAEADRVTGAGDLAGARSLTRRLTAIYRGRRDMEWGLARLAEAERDTLDADTLLAVAEDTLLRPLDDLARVEIEAAARQVAAVTALVPLALADVAAAFVVNIRMIRRIFEIYGGRAGGFGSWRLARAVFAHIAATGAVAVGDDMLGSLGGGHLLARLSRRFGEGLVNGALTARVGIAAMEVCRPLPFRAAPRPRVSQLVRRALSGLFDRAT